MSGLLSGKNIVVMGVANDRSIAWAIARSLKSQGANLAFTYESERVEERVRKLTETMPGSLVLPCNVTSDEDIDRLADALRESFGVLHGVVHSIAFAKTEELEGMYVNTSRAGFALAHDISVYSLTAVARKLYPLMTEGGSIMTMTYLGAERAMPNYNVMGVAKAALEASVRYLAADLGPVQHPRQRDLGRPDPHARGEGDQGLQLDPAPGRGEGAAAPDDGRGGSRRHRDVPDEPSVARHYGRSHLRGQRLPYRRRVRRCPKDALSGGQAQPTRKALETACLSQLSCLSSWD